MGSLSPPRCADPDSRRILASSTSLRSGYRENAHRRAHQIPLALDVGSASHREPPVLHHVLDLGEPPLALALAVLVELLCPGQAQDPVHPLRVRLFRPLRRLLPFATHGDQAFVALLVHLFEIASSQVPFVDERDPLLSARVLSNLLGCRQELARIPCTVCRPPRQDDPALARRRLRDVSVGQRSIEPLHHPSVRIRETLLAAVPQLRAVLDLLRLERLADRLQLRQPLLARLQLLGKDARSLDGCIRPRSVRRARA